MVVSVPDIASDGRWPDFAGTAVEHGLASSLSLPLVLEDRAIGSINLYSTRRTAFGGDSQEMGVLFAQQAAIALRNASNAAELRLLADQLRDGLRHRDIIGQAKGILMAQQRITADAAFDLLKAASQHQNRKLRDVAEDLAATGRLPER
jgi:GAF domain-containing protein